MRVVFRRSFSVCAGVLFACFAAFFLEFMSDHFLPVCTV